MDYNNIGKVIFLFRKQKKISRSDLCSGICSEKQLYRIETLKSIPSIYLIQQLSYRLGVNLTSYLTYSFCENPIYVTQKIKEIESHYLNRNYIEVIKCIQMFDKNYYKYLEIEQIMRWYETIAMSNENLIDLSYDILLKLLAMSTNKSLIELCTSYLTDNELRITHSIISLYCKKGDYKSAKHLLIPLIKNLENLHYTKNNSIYLQLLYNLSKLYYIEKKYSDSIHTAKTGINFCRTNNFLHILPDFFYIYGQCYEASGDISKAIEYFRYFIYLYEIQGHNIYSEKCKKDLIEKYSDII